MAMNKTHAEPMIQIGEVVQLVGEARAVGANGVERVLVGGDVIYSDDVITTGPNGAVVIQFLDGSRFDLGRNAVATLDPEVFDVHRLTEVQDAIVSANALKAMIAAGIDPTARAEAPAAGEEQVSTSAESGVALAREGHFGQVTAGFETHGLQPEGEAHPPVVDDSSLLFATLPPTVDLDADDSSGALGNNYIGDFIEDGGPVPIADQDTLVTNIPSDRLSGATITLTNASHDDSLSVTQLPPGIQASIDHDGDRIVVHLSGDATVEDYQNAIEAVRFNNSSDAPDTDDRHLEIRVFDSQEQSEPALSTLHVTAVNDAPVAVPDSGTTGENQPLLLDVLANDYDPDVVDTLALTGATIKEGGGSVQIQDGQLLFDPGSDFDSLAEGESAQVTIEYDVTDSHGATSVGTAVVTVNGANEAPVVEVNSGYIHGDVRQSTADFVEGGGARGLLDNAPESQPIDPQLVNGLGVIEMAETRNVDVKFNHSGGGYDNVLGWYKIGANGEILDPQIVWENTDVREHGWEGVHRVSLGELQAGTRIGFFLISDGAADLPDGAPLEFRTADGRPATIYDSGNEIGLYTRGGDAPITDQPIFHTAADIRNDNLDLNPDGMQHVISAPSRSGSHMVIGFEDILGGGDQDYNDLIFRVYLNQPTVAQGAEGMGHLRLALTDDDSDRLSGAEVRVSHGLHPGDQLVLAHGFTVDPGDNSIHGWEGEDTGLRVEGGGFDPASGTLHITGEGSIGLYEEILNAVRLETDGSPDAAGTRTLAYAVTDDTGLESEVTHVQVNFTADRILGTTGDDVLAGGDGNDVLYGSLGADQIDAGAGDDILVGSDGNDILTGGPGADLFVYRSGDVGTDTITDYDSAQGDVLDLSQVLSDAGATQENIDQYVQLNANGDLFVDQSGSGSFDGEALARLEGIGSGETVTLLVDDQTLTVTGV